MHFDNPVYTNNAEEVRPLLSNTEYRTDNCEYSRTLLIRTAQCQAPFGLSKMPKRVVALEVQTLPRTLLQRLHVLLNTMTVRI